MLKEHEAFFRRLLIIGDGLLVTAAFFAGYFLKIPVEKFFSVSDPSDLYPLNTYFTLLPWIVLVWLGSLFFLGTYQSFRTKGIPEIISDLIKGMATSFVVFGGIVFVLKLHFISRTFILLVFALSLILIGCARMALFGTLFYFRKKGYNYREILLVGSGRRVQTFLALIKKHPEWGFKIIGLIDDHPELRGKEIMGYQIIGMLNDIPNILETRVVDDVIFMVPRSWLPKMEEAVLYCENLGKRVSIAVDLFNVKFAKITQSKIHQLPFLTFETTPDKIWQLFFKRVLDISLSLAGIAVLSPLLLLTAVLIKLDSPGPVLFTQKRSTLNGRVFKLFKFRTMVVDAEAQLAKLRQHNEMGGPAFKMTNDPRITPLGRWLRKLSIDELPQFFNVLKGDMSLIGPRPPIPAEVEKYEPWQRRRLSMKPGISGLWQVSGRNKISDFDSWMKLDLEYIDQWSLWLDFRIFCKTIPVVLFGIGAK